MSRKIEHIGEVKNGKLQLDNKDIFKEDLQQFEGNVVEVIVKGRRNTRSLRMNRYYWGVVIRLVQKQFNEDNTFGKRVDSEFVHDFFKYKFLGTKKILGPDKQLVEVLDTTTDTDNKEFIAFFESIIAWCAEFLHLEIPYPHEEIEGSGAQ